MSIGAVKKGQRSNDALFKDIETEVSALMTEIKNKASNEELVEKYNRLYGMLTEWERINPHEVGKNIDELKNVINELGNKISQKAGFPTRMVEVNGRQIPMLATVFNPIEGKSKEVMEKTLRSEAAKRIFGVGTGLKEVPEKATVRIPTSEIRPYSSTGGMSIVPKEIADNLAKLVAGKQDVKVIVDSPLYLGRTEKDTFLELVDDKSNGIFRWMKTSFDKKKGEYKTEQLAKLELIDTFKVPVHTDSGIVDETVRMFRTENNVVMDIEELKVQMSPKTLAEVEETIKKGGTFESKGLTIRTDSDGNVKAYAKVQNIFYDNRKFYLDTPVETYSYQSGASEASRDPVNIYTNKAYTAGETERFAYFDRFFYEGLFRGKSAKTHLHADLIIGNDWQTGGISAMIRQLTTVRKYYDLAPEVADKIQNTPIITIMHNAGLSGGVWHSQPKLLNILFGEHAATITENSWMPNIHHEFTEKGVKVIHEGLPKGLQNALMENEGVNPQMMAAAYSDYIVPVSGGYADEIATQDFYGGARRKIFELRAGLDDFYKKTEGKENEYEAIMSQLAAQNGLDKELLMQSKPTLKGILNGSDRINNTLTEDSIKKIALFTGLRPESIKFYNPEESLLAWHNANKATVLPTYIEGVEKFLKSGGRDNPLRLMEYRSPENGEMLTRTDLTGVTANTPWITSAGRIVQQKGIENYVNGIKYWCEHFYKPGEEVPVFWLNGEGPAMYYDLFLKTKNEIAQKYPEVAKRMVCSELFGEAGAYDTVKLVSDAIAMSSNFEPCGLVHKEIAQNSAALPIVNKTGGLVEGLEEGVDAFVSDYRPGDLGFNGESFGKAINEFVTVYKDKAKFEKMMEALYGKNFDWAVKDGAMDRYMKLMSDLGVLKENVRNTLI